MSDPRRHVSGLPRPEAGQQQSGPLRRWLRPLLSPTHDLDPETRMLEIAGGCPGAGAPGLGLRLVRRQEH